MTQNRTSPRVSSRPSIRSNPSLVFEGVGGSPTGLSPRAADRRLLRLLGEHRVLTTGQLIQITRIPERTAQYRLGILYRAGLVVRHRPRTTVGTAPYHFWLTAFGAAAAGCEAPESWGDDLAGVQTLAAANDLWLGLRDGGSAVGVTLTDWHPLPAGLAYRDPATGADRRLGADAGLTVRNRVGRDLRALVVARLDRVPQARLSPVVTRWANYLATGSAATPTGALFLTRSEQRRMLILGEVGADAVSVDRVAVAVVGQRPASLATGPVWRTAEDDHHRRLVEVLARVRGATR
jgi:hypothetical protein